MASSTEKHWPPVRAPFGGRTFGIWRQGSPPWAIVDKIVDDVTVAIERHDVLFAA